VKERLVWRSGFETLDQARKEIASYIETYYRRALAPSATAPRRRSEDREDGQRLVESAA
jgi:hypothetical protein